MQVKAIAKSVRISPRKVRLVADAIRNRDVEDAYRTLEVTHKRAASVVSKTLKSAVANAVVNAKLDSRNLFVSAIMVNEAPAMKRFRPSTRGRIHPYKKRGSHLTIVLEERAVSAPAKAAVTPEPTVSEKADAAVEAAMYGKEEKKQSGAKKLVSKLTGKKEKTEKKEEKAAK